MCAFKDDVYHQDDPWQKAFDVYWPSDFDYEVWGTEVVDGENVARVYTLPGYVDERSLHSPGDESNRKCTHWYSRSKGGGYEVGARLYVRISIYPDHFYYLTFRILDPDQARGLDITIEDITGGEYGPITLTSEDTGKGVYVRFRVKGPADLTIELVSGSCNPCLSGVFIDKEELPGIPEFSHAPLVVTSLGTCAYLLFRRRFCQRYSI